MHGENGERFLSTKSTGLVFFISHLVLVLC